MTSTANRSSAGGVILSSQDLRFLLHDWPGIEELTTRARYEGQSRDVDDDVLELAERIATERFAPHNRASDLVEPLIDEEGRVAICA